MHTAQVEQALSTLVCSAVVADKVEANMTGRTGAGEGGGRKSCTGCARGSHANGLLPTTMSASHTSQMKRMKSAPATAVNDISACKNLLVGLATNSNAHLKACTLPPELVMEILLAVKNIWPPHKYTKQQYWSGWMTLLHICSSWRKVALSAPTLWQNIDMFKVHPDSTTELFRRSMGLPMHLTFAHAYDEMKDWDEDSMVHLGCFNAAIFHRLKTLLVCNVPWEGQETLYRLLSHNAPNMSRLGLRRFYPGDAASDEAQLSSPPRLRQLSLLQGIIPIKFALLTTNLTHLKTNSMQLVNGSYLSSVKEVLSLFSTLSALEHLDFDLPRLSKGKDAVLPQVVLPCGLKYMAMDTHFDTDIDSPYEPYSITLLKHLSISTATNANISLSWVEANSFPVCEQLFRTIFADDLKSGRSFELEFRDGYGRYERYSIWHMQSFYSWDPVTKTPGAKRFDIGDSFWSGDNSNLVSMFQPQSVVLSSRYLKRLVEDVREKHLWSEFWAAKDVRCLSVCFSDHQLLWPVLNATFPSPNLPFLDTIIFTSTSRAWKEVEDEYKRRGREYDFIEKMPALVECAIDTSELTDLVAGLVKTFETRSDSPLREVRIDGRLAQWEGWEAVRSVVDVVVA